MKKGEYKPKLTLYEVLIDMKSQKEKEDALELDDMR